MALRWTERTKQKIPTTICERNTSSQSSTSEHYWLTEEYRVCLLLYRRQHNNLSLLLKLGAGYVLPAGLCLWARCLFTLVRTENKLPARSHMKTNYIQPTKWLVHCVRDINEAYRIFIWFIERLPIWMTITVCLRFSTLYSIYIFIW